MIESVVMVARWVRLWRAQARTIELGAYNVPERQSKKSVDPNKGRFAAAVLVLCCSVIAPVAQAGSISANTGTYAGDIAGLAFPAGTVIVSEYVAYRHSGTLYDSDGVPDRTANLDLYTNVVRADWIAGRIFGRPVAVSGALNYANPQNVRIGGATERGETTWFAPAIYVTWSIIANPKSERDLAISNYIVLPAGHYDSNKRVNPATPHQTTDIVQLTYQEGLGKISKSLKNFWIDVFGGVAFHSDGDNPVTIGGAGFARTVQQDSYDINAYLRYNWAPLTFAAIGIEKSWGGEQIATGGTLGAQLGDVSLGKDEYVKGHLQFGVPLSKMFMVSADVTHDFWREGGFKEDFTAEVRLSVIVMPDSKTPQK